MMYYNTPDYSYCQQYSYNYGYSNMNGQAINLFEDTNTYRYRSRMVFEMGYRVGDFDGFRYYYRVDPSTGTKWYECYGLLDGKIYAYNLQTGNWDVVYVPQYYTEYNSKSCLDRILDSFNKIDSSDTTKQKEFASKLNSVTETINNKIKESSAPSYSIDYGWKPDDMIAESLPSYISLTPTKTETPVKTETPEPKKTYSYPEKIQGNSYPQYLQIYLDKKAFNYGVVGSDCHTDMRDEFIRDVNEIIGTFNAEIDKCTYTSLLSSYFTANNSNPYPIYDYDGNLEGSYSEEDIIDNGHKTYNTAKELFNGIISNEIKIRDFKFSQQCVYTLIGRSPENRFSDMVLLIGSNNRLYTPIKPTDLRSGLRCVCLSDEIARLTIEYARKLKSFRNLAPNYVPLNACDAASMRSYTNVLNYVSTVMPVLWR